MNKVIIYTLVILGMAYTNVSLASNEIKLFSEEGYPYKQLIVRADSVKILFIEKEKGIQCKAIVAHHQKEHKTQAVWVTKKQFEEKPLVNCLPRNKAKSLLAETF